MVRRSKPDGGSDLSGKRKAAILLVALGPEIAAEIYRNLSDAEIEQITVEIAALGNLNSDTINIVLEEFYHTAMAQQYLGTGGIQKARDILEKALGPHKALEIIARLQGVLQVTPFDFVKRVEPEHLLNFIQGERPTREVEGPIVPCGAERRDPQQGQSMQELIARAGLENGQHLGRDFVLQPMSSEGPRHDPRGPGDRGDQQPVISFHDGKAVYPLLAG